MQQDEPFNEKEQKEKWLKELMDNKSVTAFLSKYSDSSVKYFLSHYISQKVFWVLYGPHYTERMELDGIKWVEIAFDRLEIILQKKLFDLQCKWRAEQIKIEGVQLCADFVYWSNNILNCPFIEPVTRQELDFYIQFLLDPFNQSEDDFWYEENWQDYEELKAAANDSNNANTNFPEWYEYINGRTGAGALLLLPDIRGEKEEYYRAHCREEDRLERATAGTEKPSQKRDDRPGFEYTEAENMKRFVDTFESKEIRALYESYEWSCKDRPKQESVEEELNLLFSAEEPVPIEANSDWLEAVRIAASKYKRRKIAQAMPEAWEQYKMNLDMSIGYEENDSYQWLVDLHKNMILKGRRYCGEPDDLNF